MRNATSVLLTIGLVLAATGAGAQDAGPIEHGKQVYVAQKCGMCHSIAGKGNPKGALDDVGGKLTADEIRQWIVNAPDMATKAKAERKPAMKAFASLSKEDLDGLIASLRSVKK